MGLASPKEFPQSRPELRDASPASRLSATLMRAGHSLPCGVTTVGGRSPGASEPEPTRRDPGHTRIALHADPFASQGRGDPADRSRAGERIEDGPALLAAFKRRPDHGLRDRVPNTVLVRARQRQHPAQRGSARSHDLTYLPEAQEIVDAAVPAFPRACLGPEAARLKAPAGATEPAGDECVHPHPLGAVVAIADHQPQVAVGCEDTLPFTPEAHSQVVRVTFGRRTPPPSHPVRRRGQDHPDAPRRDRMEAVAVPAEQAPPPLATLVAGHGEATITPIVVYRVRPRQQPSRALALATMILVPSFFSQKTVTSARVWPPSRRRPVMIPRVVKGSFGHSTLVNFMSRRPPR